LSGFEFSHLTRTYGVNSMQFLKDAFLYSSYVAYKPKLWYRLSNLERVFSASKWVKDNKVENCTHREEYYDTIIQKEELTNTPISFFEFGVWTGNSFRHWAEHLHHPESQFFGFDTFTGLPERWRDYDKGYFDTSGEIPTIQDKRCAFVKGLLQNTLPKFLKENPPKNRMVMHYDLDLYGPTLYGLIQMYPFLKKGDIILFDEFIVLSALNHEFRAFNNFNESIHHSLEYETISAAKRYIQVAMKITKQTEV